LCHKQGPIQPQLEQPAFIANRPRLNHPFAAVACLAFRPQESFPFLVAQNSSDSIPDHHDTPQRHGRTCDNGLNVSLFWSPPLPQKNWQTDKQYESQTYREETNRLKHG